MIVGTVKETFPGERRVAITPHVLPLLTRIGCEVRIESGAGLAAGFPDGTYREKGAQVVASRGEVFSSADVVLQVRALGANLEHGRGDLDLMRRGQLVVGMFEPLTSLDAAKEIASRGVTLFAMELIPRITRAQSMDVLSSMATVAGYKAALLAAQHLPKMFPMMMTAAGTVKPARVFVVGAGVAGLQAIASSRRMGARVEAYDVRPAVKEQVESLGYVPIEINRPQRSSAARIRSIWSGISPNHTTWGRMPPASPQLVQAVSARRSFSPPTTSPQWSHWDLPSSPCM